MVGVVVMVGVGVAVAVGGRVGVPVWVAVGNGVRVRVRVEVGVANPESAVPQPVVEIIIQAAKNHFPKNSIQFLLVFILRL